MSQNDQELMDIEESDYEYMQQFGHVDVYGLYPQTDLNYGSSL